MKYIISSIAIVFAGIAWSQKIPQVPGKLDFGGIKLTIAESSRKEIQKDVDKLRASDMYFRQKLDLVNLYFPLIESTLANEGVPEDFKYLVIQESGLVSDAVSSAKAVGFWQFKDFTAREVGLRVDGQVDERKNVVSATRGAATYLNRHNFYYDNWIYSLTAYYAGRGGATRFVDESNFGAGKMNIDKHTHWYVKKFIAHLIAYRDEVGGKNSEGMRLIEYKKGENKDLDKIAKEFKVDADLLKDYNKWLMTNKVPNDKKYSVIIPVTEKVSNKLIAEEKPKSPPKTIKEPESVEIIYPEEIKEGISEPVSSIRLKINGVEAILAGKMDDINSLAADGGISIKQFIKYNDLEEGQKIIPGELYYINKKKSKSEISFHITREGETMWNVSQKYGLQLKKLALKNRMELMENPETGRVLWLSATRGASIPIEIHKNKETENVLVYAEPIQNEASIKKGRTPSASKYNIEEIALEEEMDKEEILAEGSVEIDEIENEVIPENIEEIISTPVLTEVSGKTHNVSEGETLWGISRKYDITVEELRKWNNLNGNAISVGNSLFVKEPKVKELNEPKVKTYLVKSGDTLYQIARAHNMAVGDLMNLNNKKDYSLSVGEKLQVYR